MASGLTRSASQTQVLSSYLLWRPCWARFPVGSSARRCATNSGAKSCILGLEALTASFMYQGEPLVIFVALLIIGSLGMMLGIQFTSHGIVTGSAPPRRLSMQNLNLFRLMQSAWTLQRRLSACSITIAGLCALALIAGFAEQEVTNCGLQKRCGFF